MTTEPDMRQAGVATLRDRMRAAGLSDERIAAHVEANAVLLDGRLVTDLDRLVPSGSRWHFAAR